MSEHEGNPGEGPMLGEQVGRLRGDLHVPLRSDLAWDHGAT